MAKFTKYIILIFNKSLIDSHPSITNTKGMPNEKSLKCSLGQFWMPKGWCSFPFQTFNWLIYKPFYQRNLIKIP